LKLSLELSVLYVVWKGYMYKQLLVVAALFCTILQTHEHSTFTGSRATKATDTLPRPFLSEAPPTEFHKHCFSFYTWPRVTMQDWFV
jgi:hypothetical protein